MAEGWPSVGVVDMTPELEEALKLLRESRLELVRTVRDELARWPVEPAANEPEPPPDSK